MGQPQPLFRLFLSFQTNITILTTHKCEKCPSSIRRQDSNSQPSDYESPPLTTRPGLPPNQICLTIDQVLAFILVDKSSVAGPLYHQSHSLHNRCYSPWPGLSFREWRGSPSA